MGEVSTSGGSTTLRVAVDIGGTFTDLAAVDQSTGQRWFAKASTTPDDPTRGIAHCLDKLGIRATQYELFVHGTTLVINACLEKKGARTALITTEGFRDVLEIGRGNRTESFNYRFRRHDPMVPREYRFEATERMKADGSGPAEARRRSPPFSPASRQSARYRIHCHLLFALLQESRARATRR